MSGPRPVQRPPAIPDDYLCMYDVSRPLHGIPQLDQVKVERVDQLCVFHIDVESEMGSRVVQRLPVYIATRHTNPSWPWHIHPFGARSNGDKTLNHDREKYAYFRVTVNPRLVPKDQAREHILVVGSDDCHAFVGSLKAQTSVFHESVIPPAYLAKHGLTAWPKERYRDLGTAYLKSAAQSSSLAASMGQSKAWHINWRDMDGSQHDGLPIRVAVLDKASPYFRKHSDKRKWRIFQARNFKERSDGQGVDRFTATYPASDWICYRARSLNSTGQLADPGHLLLVRNFQRHAELFAEALTAPKLPMSRPASLTQARSGNPAR